MSEWQVQSATGNAITQRFDAWGNVTQSSGTIPTYGYTGREPDASGLIFYRERYYHPGLGRFASRDPIGLQGGINAYAYAGGNPVNFNDPSELLVQNAANFAALYYGAAQQAATGFASGISGQYRSVLDAPSTAYDVGSGTRAAGQFGVSLLPGSSLPDVGAALGQGHYGTAAILLP